MGFQHYKDFKFRADTLNQITLMNTIIDDYMAQGYTLTVRQLYYQLVARGFIENTENSYKKTTSVVNDARLAGLMDWDAIEDRTRAFIRRGHWETAGDILNSAARSFHMDMWSTQPNRVFVIVEKEALAGVLERVCHKYDIPLLAARGYPSGTVLREFVESDINPNVHQQDIHILHLGDHDPSGIDMTRDLIDRLDMFSSYNSINLHRIALTMDQIDEQNPPPNPAKTTDSRFADYMRKYGDESWELDALQPKYLTDLVDLHVERLIDHDAWDLTVENINHIKDKITKLSENFNLSEME